MDASKLSGAKLRKAVAEAIGWRVYREDMGNGKLGSWICDDQTGCPYSFTRYGFAPDLKWDQGGPIIERKRISVLVAAGGKWLAGFEPEPDEAAEPFGVHLLFAQVASKPLVAAMRALVASRKASNVRAKRADTALPKTE